MNSLNSPSQTSLSAAQTEIIGLFIELAQTFGVPKSLGAIYGLLFATQPPLAFDQIVEKLQLSAGSVSQGLKLLRNIGAIHSTFVPGERRDLFVAETQIGKLAGGFFRHRVDPQLATYDTRLNALMRTRKALNIECSPFLEERLIILEHWQKKAKDILPQILASLESGSEPSVEP